MTTKKTLEQLGTVIDQAAKNLHDFAESFKSPPETGCEILQHIGEIVVEGFLFGLSQPVKLPVVIETTARDVDPSPLLLPEGNP